MDELIQLLERLYNFTYINTDENEVHLFKCNGCGKEYRIQVVSPASTKLQERQSVPAAFYKAFEQDDLEPEDNNQ